METMEDQINKEIIYGKRVDSIIAVMGTCTDQIEDYEKRNYGECMTCMGFCTAILTVIGALALIGPTVAQAVAGAGSSNIVDISYASNVYFAIACMLMLIPAAITILLYNFSMNCRRSAVLRGYMQFLEERLNEAFRETSMLYHGALFSDEIELFPVNYKGPKALGAALGALFFACCTISFAVFWNALPGLLVLYIIFYIVYFAGVLIICLPCCVLYVRALSKNRDAVKRAKETCDQLYANCSMNDGKMPTLMELNQMARQYNQKKSEELAYEKMLNRLKKKKLRRKEKLEEYKYINSKL